MTSWTEELLDTFARHAFADARVHVDPVSGDFIVSARVSRKELMMFKTARGEAVATLKRLRGQLNPRRPFKRRLHWGRRP